MFTFRPLKTSTAKKYLALSAFVLGATFATAGHADYVLNYVFNADSTSSPIGCSAGCATATATDTISGGIETLSIEVKTASGVVFNWGGNGNAHIIDWVDIGGSPTPGTTTGNGSGATYTGPTAVVDTANGTNFISNYVVRLHGNEFR
jgi:hypothetical protein